MVMACKEKLALTLGVVFGIFVSGLWTLVLAADQSRRHSIMPHTSSVYPISSALLLSSFLPFLIIQLYQKCVYKIVKTPKRSVGEGGFTSGGSGFRRGVSEWGRPPGQQNTIRRFCGGRDSSCFLFCDSQWSLSNSQSRVIVSGPTHDYFSCYWVTVRHQQYTPGRLFLCRFGSCQWVSPLYHIKTRSILLSKIQLPLVLLCYNLLEGRGDGR